MARKVVQETETFEALSQEEAEEQIKNRKNNDKSIFGEFGQRDIISEKGRVAIKVVFMKYQFGA